eukprot:13470833-Alexandrium_andersonii.AAC.1
MSADAAIHDRTGAGGEAQHEAHEPAKGRRAGEPRGAEEAAGEAVVAVAGRLAVWTCMRGLHIFTRALMGPSLARIQARLWP